MPWWRKLLCLLHCHDPEHHHHHRTAHAARPRHVTATPRRRPASGRTVAAAGEPGDRPAVYGASGCVELFPTHVIKHFSKLDEYQREVEILEALRRADAAHAVTMLDASMTPDPHITFERGIDVHDACAEMLTRRDAMQDAFRRLIIDGFVNGLMEMHTVIAACHGDVKLENALYFPQQHIVKLIDFAFSYFRGELPARKGTQTYAAPEVFATRRSATINGYMADCWSLGIVFFVLYSKMTMPWGHASSRDRVYRTALRRGTEAHACMMLARDSDGAFDQVYDITSGLLRESPFERMTVREVREVWRSAPAVKERPP